ncbi:hypothetical protein MTO96_037528 [Rhipicephalus appendiculatus]
MFMLAVFAYDCAMWHAQKTDLFKRSKPGINQKPKRPWHRLKKPSPAGGRGTRLAGRHRQSSHVSSKPKPGVGTNNPAKHASTLPKKKGKLTGNSASSKATGHSPPVDQSVPGSAPMPNPGMYGGGYPDYGGSMGTLMTMQMLSGTVSSLGEAGNGITRTVLENMNRRGESNDEDTDKENEKTTNKKKNGKEKDTKEKDQDQDNKMKNIGRESGHGRG